MKKLESKSISFSSLIKVLVFFINVWRIKVTLHNRPLLSQVFVGRRIVVVGSPVPAVKSRPSFSTFSRPLPSPRLCWRARLSICLESKVTDGLTDRWRRRMPLICLASSGASEIIQGGTVARREGERTERETGLRAAVGRPRRTGREFSDERDSPSRRASRWRRSICCSFFSYPLVLPSPAPQGPPLPLLFLSSFSFITPKLSTTRVLSFLRAFLPSFLYFPFDLSFSFSVSF